MHTYSHVHAYTHKIQCHFLHTRVGNPCYYLDSTLAVVVLGGGVVVAVVVYGVVLKFAWSKIIFFLLCSTKKRTIL